MTIYADTSFFVSLYLADQHTSEAEHLLEVRPALWMTPLHVAEWTHAIELHVFRKALSRTQADRVIESFNQHRERGLWKQGGLSDEAWDLCGELARRHGARLGMRTLDTLHVASALELKSERFWTFDNRQAKLALAVGLGTNRD